MSHNMTKPTKDCSDCADAQADLSLRWRTGHFFGFVVLRFIKIKLC